MYIGQIPNTDWLKGVVDLDEAGYILIDDLLRTNLPGVFACGDARANPLKQIAMAVGEGALAAVQAEHYLDEIACAVPERRQAAHPRTAPPARARPSSQEEHVDAVSQDNFEAEVIKAPGKVLVDFWAEWCGPCRMIGPVLEEMAGDYPVVKFVKLNVDEAPAVAQQFSVMNIPTILAFEGGEAEAAHRRRHAQGQARRGAGSVPGLSRLSIGATTKKRGRCRAPLFLVVRAADDPWGLAHAMGGDACSWRRPPSRARRSPQPSPRSEQVARGAGLVGHVAGAQPDGGPPVHVVAAGDVGDVPGVLVGDLLPAKTPP